MKPEITSAKLVVQTAIKEQLYVELVKQLNKDFELSNIRTVFLETTAPEFLIVQLEKSIEQLILEDFDSFLNFLYRVDLSEKKVKAIIAEYPGKYVKEITFLVVKREWQKVWFRSQYS